MDRMFEALAADATISQRHLARELGIALGLTNLLVGQLASRGFIRISRVRRQRVRYLLTPKGMAEKARLSRLAFQNSVTRYRLARERIRTAFDHLSARWPSRSDGKPIIFLGTGEVAEIGYVCLLGTDLRLAAVVDDHGRQEFFGVPVYRFDDLSPKLLDAAGPAQLVVVSLRSAEELRAGIAAAGVPGDRVTWV